MLYFQDIFFDMILWGIQMVNFVFFENLLNFGFFNKCVVYFREKERNIYKVNLNIKI